MQFLKITHQFTTVHSWKKIVYICVLYVYIYIYFFTIIDLKMTFKPIFKNIMNMHIKLQRSSEPDSFHVCTSLAKRVSPLAQNKHLLYTARHREAPKRVVKLPFQKLAP